MTEERIMSEDERNDAKSSARFFRGLAMVAGLAGAFPPGVWLFNSIAKNIEKEVNTGITTRPKLSDDDRVDWHY